jgi:NADPH:quinone reductase-like Zn-dependent oxidoreductase
VIRVTRSSVIDAPIERVWAVLRDFNSHIDWHPAIAHSEIENGEKPDQVGCVRAFSLKNGAVLREQLLTLSDENYVSTYCILDSTIPLKRYVATVKLSPVTDGNRTFWHWESTFSTPPGMEAELAQAVGTGVYETGFKALQEYLRKPGAGLKPAKVPAATSATTGSAHSIVMSRHGGPEVFSYTETPLRAPQAGQVTLKHTAIGVNYIDVYVRNGLYGALIELPGTPGMEAAGVITAVGPGVTEFAAGDRVAYACPPVGAYTTARTMDIGQLVKLPANISDEIAAAVMLKGMSAEYLLHRIRPVKAGDTVLVHAAAGGVGLLLCQWASRLGAKVIGTVSSESKAQLAADNGCALPIVTRDYRFADAVLEATGGKGADIVFDGLGKLAFEENLRALALCSHWVSFGQASGAHDAVALERLGSKSIALSRPVLFHYTADADILKQMAGNVFAAIRAGVIQPHIGARFALADTAKAHEFLESRASTGAIILEP